MAEAKRGKFGKEGEASRFLKIIVEVLKCRSMTTRCPAFLARTSLILLLLYPPSPQTVLISNTS